MVLRAARFGPSSNAVQSQSQEELPPSTLAAQLVDKYSRNLRKSQLNDSGDFRQLLEELLHTQHASRDSASLEETNVLVNYKLIYVLVKAGLDPLRQNSPFDSDLVGQAVSSLIVIRKTLQRCPAVLSFFPENDATRSEPGGPLYSWLIPRILRFFEEGSDSAVKLGAEEVLRTILSAQRKAFNRKVQCGVQRYVERCIQDLLSASTTHPEEPHKPSRFAIPTLTTISDSFPLGLQEPLHTMHRVRILNTTQALTVTLHLLSIVSVPLNAVDFAAKQGSKANKAIVTKPTWVIGCFRTLWYTMVNKGVDHAFEGPLSSCVGLFLISLSDFMSYCNNGVHQYLYTSQAVILLCESITVVLQFISKDISSSLEYALCSALLQFTFLSHGQYVMQEAFCEHLLPKLIKMMEEGRFDSVSIDLKNAVLVAIQAYNPATPGGASSVPATPEIAFRNLNLNSSYQWRYRRNFIDEHFTTERPRKRLRFSDINKCAINPNLATTLIRKIYSQLGLEEATDLNGLNEIVMDAFPKISENEQCVIFGLIGHLACAYGGSLSSRRTLHSLAKPVFKCSICDTPTISLTTTTNPREADMEQLLSLMGSLLRLEHMQGAIKPRVAAMLALKRLLSHTDNLQHLNFKNSPFAQWCMQALRSSLRDLRIAAGRTLPVFLQRYSDKAVLQSNRVTLLDFLRNYSKKGEIMVQETCILAWGQIAAVSDNDELNIILLRLIEYLGHTNPVVSGLAYNELQWLCNHSTFTAMRIFTPFWRTIAVTIVKDLQSRPQIAQQVSELLGMSVREFLNLTQVHTVPHLVMIKTMDILQRVADASNMDIWSLCIDRTNMAATIAYIMLQPSQDLGTLVMVSLRAADPGFESIDLTELLKAEPVSLAIHLLKVADENDMSRRPRALEALQFLANTTHGKPGSTRSSARKSDYIGPFFDFHVLGIMTQLAEVINDGKGPQPLAEKRRCLGAMRQMILLSKRHISNGLPQICACVRSAIENPALASKAFQTWIEIMNTLPDDDIEALVDPTFAITALYWDSFDDDIQVQTENMIGRLLKIHGDMIRDMVNTIPSVASIPLLSKYEDELSKLRAQMDTKHRFQTFSKRCQHEHVTVVLKALIELKDFLVDQQGYLHESAISEQPDPVVAQLTRSVLDACVRFNDSNEAIAGLSARCLGLIGCLDPGRVEAVKETKEMLVVSNFGNEDETIDFAVFFLREILVKAFLSATNTRAQGFLSYAIQEILKFCELDTSVTFRTRDVRSSTNYRRWVALPESVRNTLTPFLSSKYILTAGVVPKVVTYPIYDVNMTNGAWIRTFVVDLLEKAGGDNATALFPIFTRIIRGQDISISHFLLPFAALNVVVGGQTNHTAEVLEELLGILQQPLPSDNSKNVFRVLDYFSRWIQAKKKEIVNTRLLAARAAQQLTDGELDKDMSKIQRAECILSGIPAKIISHRAIECKSYARALFHWEQYIRQEKTRLTADVSEKYLEPMYKRLQDIYTEIDEPDGIEGISAHLQVLNIDQQILEHQKAGQLTAAQSWYELCLAEKPDNLSVQFDLMLSLRESGQHDVLLKYVDGFTRSPASIALSLPFATESSWITAKWDKLKDYLNMVSPVLENDFNVGIGTALMALSQDNTDKFSCTLDRLRQSTAQGLSNTSTASLQACHDLILRFHVLTEIEALSGIGKDSQIEKAGFLRSMSRRLDVLGANLADKQYLLGIRRATMLLSKHKFTDIELASAWLTSAKLARKGDFMHQAFSAVLHASQLGDASATIEHSRLLWKEGHHRKAIQSLEGAIAADAFRSHDNSQNEESISAIDQANKKPQNPPKARAHLLLAKWIDRAGHTQSDVIVQRYTRAVDFYARWEKGHYYLGKHYNKLLESEKLKLPAKQSQPFITGEISKLVVENYLRSLSFGAKYIYQTLPRILTLWMDIGASTEETVDPNYGGDETFRTHVIAQRKRMLNAVHLQLKKYIDRLPAWVFYTALSQILARLCNQNTAIRGFLVDIVAKVVGTHAPQALWPLLAVFKSSTGERQQRGIVCMNKIIDNCKKTKDDDKGITLRQMMHTGGKLSDQLLRVCETDIPGKKSNVSITKDLGFNHKFASCKLVIPLESTLTASLPPVTDNVEIKRWKAFPKETINIEAFLDDVLVLSSLQRPRKISIRGSDGRVYGLLCKPKDDLRKDQRLMEFNSMINRSLKRDAESSKRRLYIKTYAVTPLNEECGLIEWVDNLKTLREILLANYKQRNIHVNYSDIRLLLDEAISDGTKKIHIYTHKILSAFPPVFHEWIVDMFPEPSAWFSARLRYTRSCAVMSIVGHVLGLGDRHGENILFEESTGGTFHVDFNCLFDKGLTFEKPELVPFRLTHNMVDAFGAYGYDGPFRKSCELTLGILRANEDTLMTILETFLHDPTTDFIGTKKKKVGVAAAVPDTPEGVLESVRNKVRGLLRGESVPLSVEGYVQELIMRATDPVRLASMYIGWCAFF